jgi:N-methylhydantoinase A
MGEVERGFRRVYADRYGAALDSASEIVSYRLTAWGLVDKPQLPRLDAAGRSLAAARRGSRPAIVGGRAHEAPVLARDRLALEERIAGPAIIEEAGATTLLPPGWTGRLEPCGSLVLERS